MSVNSIQLVMKKKRLLVCAYAFSPTLGSEFAQGWNYVNSMRQDHDITVLVGSSDGRMGDFELLKSSEVQSLAGVTVVPVMPDRFGLLIKRLDVGLGMSWLFVLALKRWHQLAYRLAVRLHHANPFDVVHQLGPVGFRNPGYLHKLAIPSYWGPIGGFQYIKLQLAFRSSIRYGVISLIRNISTFMSAHSPYVANAVKGFSALSFATKTNRENFLKVYAADGPVLSDQATVLTDLVSNEMLQKLSASPLCVVWCGSIDDRKNIRLLVDIATKLQPLGTDVRFKVIGTGPRLEISRATASDRGLTNIEFTGQIPRSEVREHFRNAHVLCFTSLSEANTSTFFEALEAGCIPIALDLDGFTSNITDAIGFKIPVDAGYDNICRGFAQHLDLLSRNPSLVAARQAEIHDSLRDFSWMTLADKHRERIGAAISNL